MFGRTLLSNNTVMMTRVSADNSPQYKVAGITVDWTNVVAVATTDATLADGSVIKVGQKYLRYGQIMTKVTSGQQDTLTVTGGAGTFTVTVGGQTTAATAFDATAATLQTNIRALSTVGAGNATVTGSAGGPYTITIAGALGNQTITALGAGGATATLAATAAIGSNFNYFGPYDPAAVDGRQNLNRGDCFILDETVLQYGSGTPLASPANDQIGGVFDTGLIWIDRVLHSGVATHTLALGPTLAEFLTAFPRVSLVRN